MPKDRIREAVNLIKDFFKNRNIKVDKIIIFGSYSKGNYSKDSDIDIAIISQDFDGKDIFEKTEMLKGLKWLLVEDIALPFDIIPISLQEWKESSSLIVEFAKEGKVLL